MPNRLYLTLRDNRDVGEVFHARSAQYCTHARSRAFPALPWLFDHLLASFIVCTDAIANGLTTSPSNSKLQPHMAFPKFVMRDMVESQFRLMKEKLGIVHVIAVVGPSMGGMQALQWGVSHPDYMDALVAMEPLAKTPAWSVAVVEASRKAIMNDPAWKAGEYDAPPARRAFGCGAISCNCCRREHRTCRAPSSRTAWTCCRGWKGENALMKAFDANDWIYQTWAYERHDVGTTPGFNGDTARALASIKAKTLILTGTKDLLNPEFEPRAAGNAIPNVRMMTISPGSVTGHAPAGGAIPADVDFLNRQTAAFLDGVTGRKTDRQPGGDHPPRTYSWQLITLRALSPAS